MGDLQQLLEEHVGLREYVKFRKACGYRALRIDEESPRMELDSLFWMGACTKLITAIAALQCVERDLFALDEDVTRILPELKDIEIQYPPEEEGGPPRLVKAKNKITLRQLLNDTSGIGYSRFSQRDKPLIERCLAPLHFEPGEGFIYGAGPDWAGFMVERVTGLPLKAYVVQHICQPLKLKSICFCPDEVAGTSERIVEVCHRPRGVTSIQVGQTPQNVWPTNMTGASGGCGVYATIPEFQKILHSITNNDAKLLPWRLADELFLPEMNHNARETVVDALQCDCCDSVFGGSLRGVELAPAMGGIVLLEDLPGRGSEGTLYWGGPLNVFYWIDRQQGMSGVFGSQVFPSGDGKCLELFAEFEYRMNEIHELLKYIIERVPESLREAIRRDEAENDSDE